MRAALRAGAAALACVLGCRTPRDRTEVPALIVNPTALSRAALSSAVSAALQGAPVTLADDALTADPVLLVDRVTPRDAGGTPLQGRERGRPERFELVKSGPACILVHEPEGRRSALPDTDCAPISGVPPPPRP